MSDIENSLLKLFPRKKNLVRNSLIVNRIDDMQLFAPFKHCSFKRSSISESNFIESELSYSAWSESNFYKTIFNQCTINGANMQLCVFDQCQFLGAIEYRNISFCNSLFKNTTFKDIVFKNCILTDTLFISCSFINCKFASSSFDGAKFVDCTFDRLVARNLNLDYSQYRNCHFHNSQISLFQISYTIGLLQCIGIDSNNEFAFQGRTISTENFYNEYINYLCDYFQSRNDLYPISNLLFFLNKPTAKVKIIDGIKNAIINQKYRLVLHFCELINYYNCLSSHEKRELINFLNSSLDLMSTNENIGEAIKYSILIEHYLLDKYDNVPLYYISIETDYCVENNSHISNLITDLDDILMYEQGDLGEHNITITHNSPLWLDIILAIGGSIIGAYLKEAVIDRLVNKIKMIFRNRKIRMKKLIIKSPEDGDGKNLIVNAEDDNNDD